MYAAQPGPSQQRTLHLLLLVCGTVSSAHFLQSVWSPVVTEEAVQSMCSVCTLCLLPQPPHMLVKADGILVCVVLGHIK